MIELALLFVFLRTASGALWTEISSQSSPKSVPNQ